MTAGIFIETELFDFSGDDAALIKKALAAAVDFENFTARCEINVTITDNAGIREMNKNYRDIDAETDVLSFPFYTREDITSGAVPEQMILGDIVISFEKAVAQAKLYGHGKRRELAFLAVHGALHLLGYDHANAEEEKIMEDKQEGILKNISLPKNINGKGEA